jgi:nucleoside-diphosphate-sugar epimerase
MAVLHLAGHVVGALGALLRRDFAFTPTGARLMALTSPADHGKATRELGWHPEPTEQAIRSAARFYLERSNA